MASQVYFARLKAGGDRSAVAYIKRRRMGKEKTQNSSSDNGLLRQDF